MRMPSAIAVPVLLGALAAAPAAGPEPVTVTIKNFAFVPASLSVRAGARVRFVNEDEEPHTVTASDKSFDSEGLDVHQSWQHMFATPGSYAYFCELHPAMKGLITVTK